MADQQKHMKGSQLMRHCPLCKDSLHVSHEGSVEIDVCKRCGGIWLDGGELEQIADEIGRPRETLNWADGDTLAQRGEATELTCPTCAKSLVTHRYHDLDHVELDVCDECRGIWLESGELQRAQAGRARRLIEQDTTAKTWLLQFLLGLPSEYNIRPRRFPVVTVGLIFTCVAVMLGLLVTGSYRNAVMTWGFVPGRIGSDQSYITLLTHAFLHGGLAHLVLNMYFLYILGDNVEDVLGRAGYLAFYLVAALAGVGVHWALNSSSLTPMVGASGAISGVIAAYVVFFRHAKLTFMLVFWQFKLGAPGYFGIWVAINVLGLVSGSGAIAWGAHLGGFACGLVVALALDGRVIKKNPMLQLLRRKPAV